CTATTLGKNGWLPVGPETGDLSGAVCRVTGSTDHLLRSALRSTSSQRQHMMHRQLAHRDDVRLPAAQPWADRPVRIKMLADYLLVGPPSGPGPEVRVSSASSGLAVGRCPAYGASSANQRSCSRVLDLILLRGKSNGLTSMND